MENIQKIHRSKTWTIIKIVMVVSAFIILYLLIKFLVLKFFQVTPILETAILNIMLFVLIVLSVAYFLGIYLKYKKEFFELKSNEIIRKDGIIFSKYTSYLYDNFEFIEFKQNIIEKYLNFGTIKIKVSSLDSNLIFRDIENPELVANKIKKYIDENKKIIRYKNNGK